MDEKSLQILEYHRILDHLGAYCAFQASVDKAHRLRPAGDIFEARRMLAETSEAVSLLATRPDFTIGGARDIRAAIELANRGGVLEPSDLLDVKFTLAAARNLERKFDRLKDQYPLLYEIASQLPPQMGIIDAISRAISDHGEILDSASQKLSNIRRDLRIVHERLISKLQRMVADSKISQFLQEALVTQRDGRYVLPLRAEFKGRIKSVIHDQSSSGATLFVEPLAVVELNNQYRELQLAERDEVRRILAELSALVGQHSFEVNLTVEIVADLDFVLARAKLADKLKAVEPILHPLKKPVKDENGEVQNKKFTLDGSHHPGSVIRLFQARHPLLDPSTLALGVNEVVPIDVELDPQTYVLVITGPNTGGKTVTLKTVGLLALMAQSGLHIPAQSGSEISVFKTIFADIGDEQSIQQSLSTFSGHITNIIRILEGADSRSLVVLDELGAGTDPGEGAALARAILTHLLGRGITTLVTTHHPELKAYAYTTPGVTNASVEFDIETLKPTFRLTIGLPGRSNALAIAARLGLPDGIIEKARSQLNPEDLHAEDMLDEILRQRDLAQKARSDAEIARQEAQRLRDELLERLDHIEDERRDLLGETQAEAELLLKSLRTEANDMRQELARTRSPADPIETVLENVDELSDRLSKTLEKEETERYIPDDRGILDQRPIRLGDEVHLRKLGASGVVSSLSDDEAEVQVGRLRVRANLSDLALSRSTTTEEESIDKGVAGERSMVGERLQPAESWLKSPGMELDLRGKRADEALDALDQYIDAAFLAGMPFVRIIHGKGTGKLRSVVRQALGEHPQIKSFEVGGDNEGGEGVTVAKFKI